MNAANEQEKQAPAAIFGAEMAARLYRNHSERRVLKRDDVAVMLADAFANGISEGNRRSGRHVRIAHDKIAALVKALEHVAIEIEGQLMSAGSLARESYGTRKYWAQVAQVARATLSAAKHGEESR